MKNISYLLGVTMLLTTVACTRGGPSDSTGSTTSSSRVVAHSLDSANNSISVNNPPIAMAGVYETFTLIAGKGLTIKSAIYDFGDGVPSQSGTASWQYAYAQAGSFTVNVTAQLSDGSVAAGSSTITIVPAVDGMECVDQMALTGPSSIDILQNAAFSLTVPTCLSSRVASVSWDFGDQSASQSGESVSHVYANAGSEVVTVSITLNGAATPFAHLSQNITVIDPNPVVTPPVTTPPVASPPVDSTSPVVTTPVETNPVVTPPVVTPPVVTPPVITPPVVTPPVDTTPVVTPPVVVPPVVTPPVVVPPIVSTPVPPALTYAWVASASYSKCSADCGGTQSLVFTCQDSNAVNADASLCSGSAPVVSIACDGAPGNSVKTETGTTTETSGQSAICPANQIGTVTQTRQVVTETNYACVNHQVAVTSTEVTPSPWTVVSNCQDPTTLRCAQEQISPQQARARYRWMLRCRSRLSEIERFLSRIDRFIDGGVERGVCENSREVYATFMIRHESGMDEVWRAPVREDAECKLPPGAFIAADCGLGGATEGQSILSAKENHHLGWNAVETARGKNYDVVGTMLDVPWFNPIMIRSEVSRWVSQDQAEDHDVLTFTMRSGRQLTVTPGHHVLDHAGNLRPAREFRVGEPLILVNGDFDRIRSIEPHVYHGFIDNLFTKSDLLQRNVVATNGYLNATANHPSRGVWFVNRRLFQLHLGQGACR